MLELNISEYLREWTGSVDEQIDELISKRVKPKVLSEASRHLIEAGGKRLRPCLTLASCESVGGSPRDALKTAAAIELLHTFTLVHDDIMDQDGFRRDVETVHRVWGQPTAIIAGDALFAKVFEAISENAGDQDLSSERAINLFDAISEAVFKVCQGQALDMEFEDRVEVAEAEYLEMAEKKTGALFEASTKSGALLGRGSPEEVEALTRYGRLLGIAYQIRDDVLGIMGEQERIRKPVGSDIRDGKLTLIVIYALNSASKKDRRNLLQILKEEGASESQVNEAISILNKTGAVNFAEAKAREIIDEAKSELEGIPPSEARRFLFELAEFSIEREL